MRHALVLSCALLVACQPPPSPEAAATTTAPPAPPAPPPAAAGEQADLGRAAPDFELTDLDGKPVKLGAYRGKTVVLEWFNPGCPFVKAAHGKGSLRDTAKRAAEKGVVWLAVNSGAPGKQGHGKDVNREAAQRWAMAHPILLDETGRVGKQYGATNTPHMFVIDPKGTLVYAGAIDNSPDGEGDSPEGGKLVNYVDAALTDLAASRPVAAARTRAYGCSVKYAN